jgi:hypothetical protein
MKQFHQMSCRDLSPAERQFLTILQRQKDVESRVAVENEWERPESVESNDSRVTSLYDALLRLTTAALDGLRVFNSSMRTGINL